MDKLENFLAIYLVKKAPFTIPTSARIKIVAFAPWIVLVIAIMFLPLLMALLGLNFMFFAPAWSMMGSHMYGWGTATVIALIPFALEVLALPGLFKKKKYAWKLLMYSSLIAIVQNVLFFSIGGILGGVIGLYILFQVKEYYK